MTISFPLEQKCITVNSWLLKNYLMWEVEGIFLLFLFWASPPFFRGKTIEKYYRNLKDHLSNYFWVMRLSPVLMEFGTHVRLRCSLSSSSVCQPYCFPESNCFDMFQKSRSISSRTRFLRVPCLPPIQGINTRNFVYFGTREENILAGCFTSSQKQR